MTFTEKAQFKKELYTAKFWSRTGKCLDAVSKIAKKVEAKCVENGFQSAKRLLPLTQKKCDEILENMK